MNFIVLTPAQRVEFGDSFQHEPHACWVPIELDDGNYGLPIAAQADVEARITLPYIEADVITPKPYVD